MRNDWFFPWLSPEWYGGKMLFGKAQPPPANPKIVPLAYFFLEQPIA
jgi:hypothetical protein